MQANISDPPTKPRVIGRVVIEILDTGDVGVGGQFPTDVAKLAGWMEMAKYLIVKEVERQLVGGRIAVAPPGLAIPRT